MKRNALTASFIVTHLLGGSLSQQSARAQESGNAESSTFDVVSIKRMLPVSGREGVIHSGCVYQADGITCQSSLLELIEEAYQVKEIEVAGPGWMHDDVVFSLRARTAPGLTREQVHAMLQKALSDRFDLRFHQETRPVRISALVPGKDGLRRLQVALDPEHREKDKMPFTTSAGNKLRASVQISPGKFYAVAMSLDYFATNYLSLCVGIPVVNMTGSTDEYKIDLSWIPTRDAAISYAVNDPEFLRTAETQLGLRLETRVMPYKIYVIDHAARVPSDN